MTYHLIQGRTVGMPVRIRAAMVSAAVYLVRADAARAVIAYSGLDVTEVLPGRAVCGLVFIRYDDSDLGAYREVGVGFLVCPPGTRSPRRGVPTGLLDLRRPGTGMFVHWLPVDQGFTLEAGRRIWGFPKELAEIELRLGSPYKRCLLRKDGRQVLDLLLRPGLPLPGVRARLTAYTHLDGVTRRVPWRLHLAGVRGRPGGALIRLGNHPVAKELSELGLPKEALFTLTARRAAMSFGDAVPVTL